jgi:hypothetical protein
MLDYFKRNKQEKGAFFANKKPLIFEKVKVVFIQQRGIAI